MEPLGAACAVAQFVGLAGQAIQAISWARQKFKEIKSAPKLIKKIYHELKVFENTLVQLSSIEKSRFSDDAARSFTATLTDCGDIFENLWNELSRHNFDQHMAGARKLWNQIIANEKRSEFENYLKRLESAKASLQITMAGMQLEVLNDFQGLYTKHARHVEDSLHGVETGVASIQTLSEKILDNTIENTEIVKAIERSVRDLRTDIPAIVEEGFKRCMNDKLEELIRRTILNQSVEISEDNMMHETFPRLKSYNKSALETCDHVRLELLKASEPPPHKNISKVAMGANDTTLFAQELASRRQRQVTVRRKTYTKNISLPIGFVQMKTVQRVYRDTTDDGSTKEREITQIDISFIPFRWLSTRGQVISIERHYDVYNRPIWAFTPRVYHRLPDNAMIVQACRNRDIDFVKKLFQYRQASPFDTCFDGSSLMILTINNLSLDSYDDAWDQAFEIIRFLISQGADTTAFIAEFIHEYQFLSSGFGEFELMWPSEDDIPTHKTDKIWRLCLESCQRDPFADQKVLERLWDHSLGGQTLPPIDPASVFHDTFSGFESLVFENPNKVFSDLMDKANTLGSGSNTSWERMINQKYELVAYLCSGGSESIKARTFSHPGPDSTPISEQHDTCFCPNMSSHLLFQLLYRSKMWSCRKTRRKALRQHIYRTLIILLESGEKPEATCACNTQWQSAGDFRTVTDVAASEGILDVWRNALEVSGFDATSIIDEWQLQGISRLCEMPQAETRTVLSPLRLASNVVHSALSSFL